MNSKVFIFCNKHDENLLALYQECLLMGTECVPIYIRNTNFDLAKSLISNNDYILVLHFPWGSHLLQQFISQFVYKKCLNSQPFSQQRIGEKLYQQQQVYKIDPDLTIITHTKTNFLNNLPLPLIAKPLGGTCDPHCKTRLEGS